MKLGILEIPKKNTSDGKKENLPSRAEQRRFSEGYLHKNILVERWPHKVNETRLHNNRYKWGKYSVHVR